MTAYGSGILERLSHFQAFHVSLCENLSRPVGRGSENVSQSAATWNMGIFREYFTTYIPGCHQNIPSTWRNLCTRGARMKTMFKSVTFDSSSSAAVKTELNLRRVESLSTGVDCLLIFNVLLSQLVSVVCKLPLHQFQTNLIASSRFWSV